MYSIQKNIEHIMYGKINYMILQILNLAEKEGLCTIDKWGMKTLKGLLLEHLVVAVVALMQDEEKEELKFYFSKKSVTSEESAIELETEIKAIIKEVLLVNFIRVYRTESEPETEYAEIVGYDLPDKESSISYFFALIVFNLSFHKKEYEEIRQLLEKPFYAFVVSVMGKNIRNEMVNISEWNKKAEIFIEKMLKENYQEYRLALIEMREVLMTLEYLSVGGTINAG